MHWRLCLRTTSFADDDDTKASGALQSAATVLDEIQGAPDQGMPEEVLGSAECVAVVPSMLKAGFIVGAGTARRRQLPDSKRLERSGFLYDWGRQLRLADRRPGRRSGNADHEQGRNEEPAVQQIQAGRRCQRSCRPVGRHASADTDWKMRAQVLTYSRARGAFRRPRTQRRGHQAGQRQHAGVLRPHGAVQDVADRKHRGTRRVPTRS